jgi:hypothetical protein
MAARYAGVRHSDGSATVFWLSHGAIHSMHYEAGVLSPPAVEGQDINWLYDIGEPGQTVSFPLNLPPDLPVLEKRIAKLERASHTHVAPMMPSS